MLTKIKGELEIDHDRGVIYFHTNDHFLMRRIFSTTVLRICNLPPIPIEFPQLDITHHQGVSWSNEKIDSLDARCRALHTWAQSKIGKMMSDSQKGCRGRAVRFTIGKNLNGVHFILDTGGSIYRRYPRAKAKAGNEGEESSQRRDRDDQTCQPD